MLAEEVRGCPRPGGALVSAARGRAGLPPPPAEAVGTLLLLGRLRVRRGTASYNHNHNYHNHNIVLEPVRNLQRRLYYNGTRPCYKCVCNMTAPARATSASEI